MEKTQILEILKEGIHNVTFTKVDGSTRVMPCTLDPTILPSQQPINEDKVTRKANESTIRAWATDVQDWRSFRVDNVITVSIVG